jgi:hypothetical protein
MIIKKYLLENYDLVLNNYENIIYKSFPTPHLKVLNNDISIKKKSIQMNVSSLNIYPKLLNIYNFENFKATKIVFNENNISIADSDLKILIDYIRNIKNRFTLKNLDLNIKRNNSLLVNFKKIYFSNYGYNKNIVKGELFGKKFKILMDNNYNKINFKLLKTGIAADIDLKEIKKKSIISGSFKSKLLNSKLKFDFEYDDKKIEIFNSYFRSRDLSFNNESKIIYRPFFSSSSIINLEDINIKILKDLNLRKILTSKDLIKKINTKNEINFKPKRFNKNFIDNINLNINLSYGRLVYSKKILISENIILCVGDINLLEEYPILYFDCSIESRDKRKFLKNFLIKYKNKNEIFMLNIEGNINIFNNKINFKNIKMNQNYEASKEDLNYFKQTFENILFDKNLLGIFNLKKIKEFILEIS